MHINRNMSAVITNNQLLRTENKLAKSMERLSSGLKINHASDNPAGIAISNKMKAQIDALDQAESNATDAISVIQIADSALNEVTSILQRMRELAVQSANGTYAYSDRKSIQDEIDELQKEVDRISKDTEYNTKTLLDGSSDVRIYGENASRFYASETVAAQTYKMNVIEAAKQATVELDYAMPPKDGRININGVVAEVIGGMDKESYLQEIRKAASEAGCSVAISEAGDKILIKSDYYGYDESIEFTISNELAEEIGINEGNEDCAYEITEVEMIFPFTKPVITPGTTEMFSINGVDVVLKPDMTDEMYREALAEAAKKAGVAATNVENGIRVRSNAIKTEMITFSYSYDLANQLNIIDNYAGDYTVNTQGKDAVVTIPTEDGNATVRTATGFTPTTTVETNGNRVTITDNNGFELEFLIDEEFPVSEETTEGNFEIKVTDIGPMTIQIGGNEHQDMEIRIAEVSAASLYIDAVDVAVAKGSDRAMNILEDAIATLSATRSRIGAFQNRLEYATTSLSATQENMTAAYSGILDTDMATEMAEYTQQNILNQAAISVLSQANELPQQVLSLLQ